MNELRNTARKYSEENGYNNSTVTTIAPTGTISMIANVSSGIEPNFSFVYKRISCDKEMYVVHPLMEEKLKALGLYTEDILNKLSQGVPVKDIPELVKAGFGDYWQISQEIPSQAHIRVQAAFQEYTDNAVSKTINLPGGASEFDVQDAYIDAFLSGCKGVTVYRDGSRDGQVLSFEKVDEAADAVELFGGIETPLTTCSDEYLCEQCGTKLEKAEGCSICYACGYSKCQ
jgi:ribonucleoside-diphosphate reductase alpha chain